MKNATSEFRTLQIQAPSKIKQPELSTPWTTYKIHKFYKYDSNRWFIGLSFWFKFLFQDILLKMQKSNDEQQIRQLKNHYTMQTFIDLKTSEYTLRRSGLGKQQGTLTTPIFAQSHEYIYNIFFINNQINFKHNYYFCSKISAALHISKVSK